MSTAGSLLDVLREQYGQANRTSVTMRQFGAALGVAVTVAVIGNSRSATLDDVRTAWGHSTRFSARASTS